ncbi:hypothetical protein [Tanticharoenia sakaeratensis]|uniref:Secreted protein n=1 Tax=Tanticharoenia sakaeratensis NBRC 103193 TaxID=1231623 RepID=A0A0D6MNF4_9PROT|nr:hypothetical protein [Tanticharoenia sakaeratensis]GAN54798.1 hypothetical protein Tasa_031_016 [Tanticharoenia sakaeratensis NBRC 103193]GBQ21527.1 hypothetical protein AA103193_1757 [Tanticharoenia sakaeratensis NBRC 103193]
MTRRPDTRTNAVNRRTMVGLGLAIPLAAPAAAATANGTAALRVDEAILRQHGAALDGHTDDLSVFQSFVDHASTATPDNSCPLILFDLPACTILFSGPLQTGRCNITVRGAGQDLTLFIMRTGGQGLLQHGTEQHPASGYLQLQDIGFHDGNPKGSGCTGISIHFAENAPQSAMTWQGVALRKWTQGARVVNCPRNWHCENVTVFGPDFALQSGAGFGIASAPRFAQGCFTYVFINVLVANYTWGWDYDIQSPLEGQRFYSCTCYNGWGMVRARVHATPDARDSLDESYRSVIWYFMECDWQGFGYALDLVHCRNIIVRGGFYIANRNTDHLPIPDARPRRRYMSFVGCGDILLDGVKFDVFAGSEPDLSLVYVDASSDHFRARDTNVLSYAPIHCAFEFADTDKPNPQRNTLSEIDTVWAAWSGGEKVRDNGGNQIAQTSARDLGGDMTAAGRISLQGSAKVTGRQMQIALPRRPGGQPWFSKPPVVMVQGQGGEAPVNLLDVTIERIIVKADSKVTNVMWTAVGE